MLLGMHYALHFRYVRIAKWVTNDYEIPYPAIKCNPARVTPFGYGTNDGVI